MKKALALVLAIVLLFCLTSCGYSDQLQEVSENLAKISKTLGDIQNAMADDQEADGSSGADQNTAVKTGVLKIGLMIHTTDWFASVDAPNYYEFHAMVDYINEDLGGIMIGDTLYTIEAVDQDGQSSGDQLRTCAQALVDAGVKFVVETNDFWVMACEDIFEDAGVLHASAYVTYTPGYMSTDSPMAFTASNGSVGDYATGFQVLKEVYPEVESVIFVNDDNGANEDLFALMKEMSDEYGIEVLDDYIMYSGDTTDYSAYAQQIIDSGADAFMGNGSPDAYGYILKELRAKGSDIVCACLQGKPATTLMEYAGEDACSNAFTLGTSQREEDKERNTDIYNALVAKDREINGEEIALNFDGAAANTLWVMLQMMQKAGSIDPAVVAAAWEAADEVDTIYGVGHTGGEISYGIKNHAIGSPRAVSVIDPEAEDGWYFWGWIDVEIP